MITLNDVSKQYGAQVLFEGVSLRFDPGKRYGIVGANGAGKSTLVRIIAGQESADSGAINIPTRTRLGTLNQDHYAFEDVTIMDVVMAGKPQLAAAFREKEGLLDDPDAAPDRIAQLEEIIADADGYVAESRIGEMLEGLGIPVEVHRRPMSVLSGGYKLRALLAQCLFGDPDALMLDEPTNHLDIFSIKWLEEYLAKQRGVVVLVSHDREFLENACTHIVDIDYGTAKQYTGNYSAFLKAKAAEEELRAIEAEKAEKKMGELASFVERFRAKATKARQAQSKAKQIERMERDIVQPVYSSRVSPRIRLKVNRDPGKQVLEVGDVDKAFGENEVLRSVSFEVRRGDKLAIIGPNGVGKSTLLKIIMGELDQDAGEVTWGHETYPQYFSQDHREEIPATTSPYDWLYQWAPGETIGTIRGTLGRMLFSGDDVHKSTAALSGGEAARLVLAKLTLLQANVLILDEPTNHLDMESIETLVAALEQYPGTVLLVSHNRYMVERVASKILEIKTDGIEIYDDDYAAYLERKGTDHLSYQVDLRAGKKKGKGGGAKGAKKGTKSKDVVFQAAKKAQKRMQQRRRDFRADAGDLLSRPKRYEEEIEQLETEMAAIDELFLDPDYFTNTDPAEVRDKDSRKKVIETELEQKYELWEEANLELEVLREKHGLTEE